MTQGTPRGPILLDEADRVVASPQFHEVVPAADPPDEAVAKISKPILVDADDEPSGRIDHGWDASTRMGALPVRTIAPSLRWLGGGGALLLLGFMGIDFASYVEAQFHKAAWLGWLTVGIFGSALGAMAFGIYREISGLISVTAIDNLRCVFLVENADAALARKVALEWLKSVERRGVDASLSRERTLKATSAQGVVDALSSSVLLRLDREAEVAGKQAAMQIAAATALSPKAFFDSALFILRGARLVREIAVIYGMRPSTLGTWSLLRRVAFGSTVVAAADLGGALAMQALFSSKLLENIGGDLAGAAAAGQRMLRIGQAAIAACRIVPKPARNDADGGSAEMLRPAKPA
ncbi:MAG: DUF697 domain-containing protein [Pseudomonadota bacterium]